MNAINSIILSEDTGGKGRIFKSRFLQPGLVKYSFGVCLLTKETIDKFINTFIGDPVIIYHQEVTDDNAKDKRVGVVSDIEFNPSDGWYWCKGVIFDNDAIDLINNGYNVSCQYEITEYSDNIENKLHNGNEYDKEILDGKFEHLAIVNNPRYEGALIAVNALKNENKKEENKEDLKATNEYKPILDYIENYDERNDKMNDETKNVFERLISALKARNEADDKDKKAENEDVDKRDIIRQIMAIAGKEEASEDVKTIAKLAEKLAYDKSEAGTADNKAKNEDKEEKEDDKKEDKEKADNCRAKNEDVDKRELIDQVGGILKGKVDDEVIRTVIKKLEEIAYDKSEAGTADNKAKNDDDEYKELKEDVEKTVDNCKAKNSMDALKEVFYQGEVKSQRKYITQKEAIELGKQLF